MYSAVVSYILTNGKNFASLYFSLLSFTLLSCGNTSSQNSYNKEYIGPQELGYRVAELFNSQWQYGITLFGNAVGPKIGIRFPGPYTAEELNTIFMELSGKEKKRFRKLIKRVG